MAFNENSCDLLENIYLCGINNNGNTYGDVLFIVVICLKISIFVASTTTWLGWDNVFHWL